MAIKAIIFDCFGVLVIAGHTLLYQDYPQFKKDFTNLQFESDSGRISRQQFDNSVSDLTSLLPQEVEDKYWSVNRFNQPMIDLIRDLKQLGKYKIGMLSNISRDWMDVSLPFFEKEKLFDAVVLSGDVAIVKPDPEIFKLIAERLGLPPNECVMIDDVPRNIEGAKQAGMQGIIYVSKDQTQSELYRLLGLTNA